MPGLELRWWSPIATPEEREKSEAEIARKLDEFRAFLKNPKNAKSIKAAIDRINREAGLPVAGEPDDGIQAPEPGDKDGK